MKQKETKMYKCYYKDGSYSVIFSKDGESFKPFSDLSGAEWQSSDFTKIEPLEHDTLQEVVDWCKCQDKEYIVIEMDGGLRLKRYSDDKIVSLFNDSVECLQHIRKPKLKQITPEELAKMGYEIVNK